MGVGVIGLYAHKYRNTFLLVCFAILQLMFSAINLQHANMSHAEAVRACQTEQKYYKNCEVPELNHCIYNNTCLVDEMAGIIPSCHAPGQSQCQVFAQLDTVFWANQLINFLTYAEPTFWSIMLII